MLHEVICARVEVNSILCYSNPFQIPMILCCGITLHKEHTSELQVCKALDEISMAKYVGKILHMRSPLMTHRVH